MDDRFCPVILSPLSVFLWRLAQALAPQRKPAPSTVHLRPLSCPLLSTQPSVTGSPWPCQNLSRLPCRSKTKAVSISFALARPYLFKSTLHDTRSPITQLPFLITRLHGRAAPTYLSITTTTLLHPILQAYLLSPLSKAIDTSSRLSITMAATATAPPPLSSPAVGVVDHEDSNISSPLSEVDTKDDNDEDIEHMHLDNDDEDSTRPSPKKRPHAASDSDSVLSDAHTSDGNVTEAETERLYDTPRHQRQRDVVVDQFNEGQVFEHTPSKLRRTANLDDHHDDESTMGDDASIGSPTIGIESPSKPATKHDAALEDDHKNDSQDRKRKRSPAADQSETEQPLRKRTSSVPVADIETPQQAEDTVMHEDEPTPANESSGTQTPAEEVDVSPRKKSTAREDGAVERTTRATKKGTRGSKRKVAAATEADHDTDNGSHDGARDSTRGTDVEQHGEELEADADEEVDAATAHDEESKDRPANTPNSVDHAHPTTVERKHAAFKDWTHIEEMFGVFRDR